MAGGIGRFAAGRKKPSQQQQNDANNASGNDSGGGEQQPNVNNNNVATANDNNTTADPTNNTANDNMEVERPSTAFNSFNNINEADADRPATSGSHGFSAINNMMFGGVNNDNDDGMMMMDDNNGVGNFGMDNDTTTAATEFAQGFSQSFDPMAAAEAAFQDFGGFTTTATDNSGVEGGGDDEQQPIVEGIGNEKNVEQPAVASVQEQPSNTSGAGVGGVGRFAKKRIVNTATASKSSTQQQQPSALAVLANTATETATLMSNADKFSPIRNPTTAVAVMNKSVVENNNSSSDLSRFDIDLMSKNTDNAVGKSNGDEGVMNVENVENQEAAVPTSIRTSGDDVEDDLTEATATTFDGDIFHEAKADDNAGEKESSKTSLYFANVTTNNQAVEKQNEEKNVGNTTKTTSPVEDAVKDVAVQQQPSPKLGGNLTNVQPPVQTAVRQTTKSDEERALSQGSSGVPRVSLSPRPSGANVMNQGGDTASSLSPKDMSSRPSQNTANQATTKDNDEDDNSIVIPGIPAAVANNPGISQQATAVARLSNTNNNIRQRGSQQQMNNNNRSFQPHSSSAKGRMTSATLQKPVLNRQKKQPPFKMNRNTMTTSNSCDIVTEKVTFALPKSRPSATNNNINTNMMMGRNQKTSTSLAHAAAAAGSTAITPDSRGVANNNQAAAAATPFGRQSDTSSGSDSSTVDDLSPHKDQAFVPTLASTITAQPVKKTMEMEPRVEEILPPQQQQRRPRSQTITSPPEALMTAPAQSDTPKVSNVNPAPSSTFASSNNNSTSSSYHQNNNSAFHTDETFDELLSQFAKDIQDGTDIYERGQNDLLGLNVDVTHAYSTLLRYRDEYTELLADIEGVQAMAESVMAEISVE